MDAARLRRLRSGRLVRHLAAAAAALLVAAAPSRVQASGPAVEGAGWAGKTRSFEYLHVEADTGASSGGHAAVRFGDDTYHFVHDEGLVRAGRESSNRFDYVYRAIGNRTIHASRIDVDSGTYTALRDSFHRRLLVQDAQTQLRDSARRDRALLAALAAGRLHDSGLRLRGAGYFFDDATRERDRGRTVLSSVAPDTLTTGRSDFDGASMLSQLGASVLQRLAERLEASYGRDYLARERRAADAEIDALAFDCTPSARLEHGRVPVAHTGFADRYERLLLRRLALEVVATQRLPVRDAFRLHADPSFRLSPDERAALAARAERQAQALVRLAASKRGDRGFALLVGLARLVAVEASLRAGALVVPDVYAEDAPVIAIADLAVDARMSNALRAERHADLARARAELVAADTADEAAWARLELAANLAIELDESLLHGRDVRIAPDTPVPSRGTPPRESLPIPHRWPGEFDAMHACATGIADGLERELHGLYAYDLVSRNCVTEIFRTIDEGLAEDLGAETLTSAELRRSLVREYSRRRIGGHVDAHAGLAFVPFVSAAAVNRSYRIAERTTLPSYRRHGLEHLRGGEGGLAARVRESNALTSTLYHPSRNRDLFLFFTDGTPMLRPALGGANVLVAAAGVGAGTLAAPFDRGRLFMSALRGLAFSAPELVFVNLRKGANGIVPRDWESQLPVEPSS